MVKPGFAIHEGCPTAEDYCQFRKSVGWRDVSLEEARAGLENSLYSLYATLDDKVVGCARVIGDGHVYFYLQDVLVDPACQKQGLGHQLVQKALDYIFSVAAPGTYVGLMAAQNKAAFYEKFGFTKRPDDKPGMEFYVK